MSTKKPCDSQWLSRVQVPRKHTPSLCVGNRATLSWKKTVYPTYPPPAQAPHGYPSLQLSNCPQIQLVPEWKDSNHSLAQLEPHSGSCSPSLHLCFGIAGCEVGSQPPFAAALQKITVQRLQRDLETGRIPHTEENGDKTRDFHSTGKAPELHLCCPVDWI